MMDIYYYLLNKYLYIHYKMNGNYFYLSNLLDFL